MPVEEVLTFGHGTASATALTGLLREAGVWLVVDVRSAPGSKRDPDVARDAMSRWLAQAGIGYRWDQRLGGWRKRSPDSPDTALRNRSFSGYAGHMRTPEFLEAVDALLVDAAAGRTAVMCAESVWWRCHRKLISDFLVYDAEQRSPPPGTAPPDTGANRPGGGERSRPAGAAAGRVVRYSRGTRRRRWPDTAAGGADQRFSARWSSLLVMRERPLMPRFLASR